MLNFQPDNAKLKALRPLIPSLLSSIGATPPKFAKIYTFSKLSGHTCPYAKDCLSKAVKDEQGKSHIVDGEHTIFRCFSASQEVLFPAVYNARKANGDAIAECGNLSSKIADLFLANLPTNAAIVRIHVGGDFKTQAEFDGWLMTAYLRPSVIFYAYTKSLPFWVKRLDRIPSNFILTASYGGYKDELIAKHGLRYVKVVNSVHEASVQGLEIDHDDSHAVNPDTSWKSFALLVHGVQPKNSVAGKAVSKLNGLGSYGRKKK